MNTVRVIIHYSALEAALLFGAGYLLCAYLNEKKKEVPEDEPEIVEEKPKKKKRKIIIEDGKLIIGLRKEA